MYNYFIAKASHETITNRHIQGPIISLTGIGGLYCHALNIEEGVVKQSYA